MEEDILLKLENVEICREENRVLHDACLTLRNGEFVYVIGKVGSGKSSLLKSLYCEIPILRGEARIMDYNLTKMKRKDIPYLRRKLGIVFQDFQLLTDRSVSKNLEFVLKATGWKKKSEIKERIDNVLRQVGMQDKGYKMPHELSGGEQQRIVIARALLNNPKLILADEPTGAVDRKTADDILEMFRKLNEKLGLTIVIVTHDKELAKKVNRVVSIRDGKTSSERIMKNDYRERMEHLDIDWQEEETQEEFAVLDRAGRVQIPSELLEQMGMDGNKVKLEFIGGKIVIEKPKD